jgi:kynurenine formamidase
VIARTSAEAAAEMFEAVKNWGRWGADDERGALNLIDPARVAGAARAVRGRVVSCGRPLPVLPAVDNPNPAQHMMVIAGDCLDATGVPGLETALDYVGVAFHGMAVSHLDALCHVFHDGQMYNGFPATDVRSIGATRNSVMSCADGVVSRGVLLDIPLLRDRRWLEPGDVIAADELDAAAAAAGITVEPGDIVLVSTGRDARRREHGPWDPITVGLAGLDPGCVRWIRDHDVAVLGGDGVHDPLPNNDNGWPVPIHMCCLVAMGVLLLDNLDLSRLADDCREESKWDFLFTVAPLQIEMATGSPVNPVAVV